MKLTKRIYPIFFVLVLFLTSCATDPYSFQTLSIKVSSSTGALFTGKYHFGNHSGEISTQAQSGSGYLLQLPVSQGQLELRKMKIDDEIAAEIIEGATTKMRAVAPPGKAGMRLVKDANGWSVDVY